MISLYGFWEKASTEMFSMESYMGMNEYLPIPTPGHVKGKVPNTVFFTDSSSQPEPYVSMFYNYLFV